jgi:hypothetical protein
MGNFSGSRELVRIFYIEINGNFALCLRLLTILTVFMVGMTFVNGGMVVRACAPAQLKTLRIRHFEHNWCEGFNSTTCTPSFMFVVRSYRGTLPFWTTWYREGRF